MRLNEESLEALIVKQMVEGGWQEGASTDYEPAYALDLPQLVAFIEATQPDLVDALSLHAESPTRHAFLSRVQGEVTKRGVVEVLRKGIGHNQHHVDFFFPTASIGNPKAAALFAENRFTVSRQVHYSPGEKGLSLDLVASINGLPVLTFELKNNITKQTFDDAVDQYKRDRDPRELIFQFGRCISHFALDDQQARFCTHRRASSRGFCRSTRAGTTEPATRPTLTASRRTTCGVRFSRRRASPTLSRTTPRSLPQRTSGLAVRPRSKSFRATTNSTSYGSFSPTSR
jgi:type I restriction enzyme R subunit